MYLPLFPHMNTIKMVGCDPDPDRRREATEHFGVARTYADGERMLATEKPDMIVICTPPALHFEHFKMALAQGCPIILEKPASHSETEFEQMLAMTEAEGRMVMVNMNYRWHAAVMRVKELLDREIIGTPYWTQVDFHGWAGGGIWKFDVDRYALMEKGCHLIDLVRHLLSDEVEEIDATLLYPEHHLFHADTLACATMKMAGGSHVLIISDVSAPGLNHWITMRIQGDKGVLHIQLQKPGTPLESHVSVQNLLDNRPVVSEVSSRFSDVRDIEVRTDRDWVGPMSRLFGHFLDCVETGQSPCSSSQDQAQTMKAVFAGYLSAKRHRPVRLDEV